MARLIRKTEEKCCRFVEIREITKEHLTITSFFIGQVFRTFDDYTFVIINVSVKGANHSFFQTPASTIIFLTNSTHYSKSQILSKNSILTTPNIFTCFSPPKIDNFLGKSKLIFQTKNEDFEQCAADAVPPFFLC